MVLAVICGGVVVVVLACLSSCCSLKASCKRVGTRKLSSEYSCMHAERDSLMTDYDAVIVVVVVVIIIVVVIFSEVQH